MEWIYVIIGVLVMVYIHKQKLYKLLLKIPCIKNIIMLTESLIAMYILYYIYHNFDEKKLYKLSFVIYIIYYINRNVNKQKLYKFLLKIPCFKNNVDEELREHLTKLDTDFKKERFNNIKVGNLRLPKEGVSIDAVLARIDDVCDYNKDSNKISGTVYANYSEWQKVIDKSKKEPEQKGIEHPEYKELQNKLNEAETKINELTNEILRAKAETENIRRRAEQDVAKAHKFGNEKFAANLLPVVDSLEHGLANCDESDNNSILKNIRHGMELTLKMFLDTLRKHNIQQIDPFGQDFNPELHEAMSIKEDSSVKPNTVVQVVQKGYTINERLLRPALVIVAKTP